MSFALSRKENLIQLANFVISIKKTNPEFLRMEFNQHQTTSLRHKILDVYEKNGEILFIFENTNLSTTTRNVDGFLEEYKYFIEYYNRLVDELTQITMKYLEIRNSKVLKVENGVPSLDDTPHYPTIHGFIVESAIYNKITFKNGIMSLTDFKEHGLTALSFTDLDSFNMTY